MTCKVYPISRAKFSEKQQSVAALKNRAAGACTVASIFRGCRYVTVAILATILFLRMHQTVGRVSSGASIYVSSGDERYQRRARHFRHTFCYCSRLTCVCPRLVQSNSSGELL
ncbi:hypothetical protein QLX08_002886 [Tetragonisca angustula]|uniref:Uncharacterized protein n=1 Tax=Tetragonisca angustula TaxID=166442 RepID=A0AAW1ABW2_9HYME